MSKVYCHDDRFMIWQVKNMLEEEGIPCYIKNEFAIGAMGELAPTDALPEVWVNDQEWLPKATRLITEFFKNPPDSSPWVCANCKEDNDASFEVCWQCGEEVT